MPLLREYLQQGAGERVTMADSVSRLLAMAI
jgi:hypothetical protein